MKFVFLDFDGTYAEDGHVPAEHVAAVGAAQRNGHKVFLCTGRPLSGLGPRALQANFDGLVCAAGGYVQIGGTVLRDQRYSEALTRRALEVLDRYEGVYILEHPEYVCCTASGEARLRELFRTHTDMLDRLKVVDSLATVRPSKITVLFSDRPIREVAAEIGPEVRAMPGSVEDLGTVSGELQLSVVDKFGGIEAVLAHIGASPEAVVACGDGLNDLEMVERAGTGVAIAGGNPDVIAAADIVVPGPRELGLVTAFRQLGLIE
ncbi:MAG: HAD hydrolase family protein [Ancrocorticia sp.]|uniref:HAD hydrolase family protein n=1 Tax=Ancrocorticia sp. TaxID=2593684 RepID=UPI003F90780F